MHKNNIKITEVQFEVLKAIYIYIYIVFVWAYMLLQGISNYFDALFPTITF